MDIPVRLDPDKLKTERHTADLGIEQESDGRDSLKKPEQKRETDPARKAPDPTAGVTPPAR